MRFYLFAILLLETLHNIIGCSLFTNKDPPSGMDKYCVNTTESDLSYTNKCGSLNDLWMCTSPEPKYHPVSNCVKEKFLYPGEYCEKNSQCIHGECIDDICVGAKTDSACDDIVKCHTNLICKDGKCTDPIENGELCDESKKQCKVTSVCSNGKCVQIASLDDESPATNALACKSLDISNKKCVRPRSIVSDETELEKKLTCKEEQEHCQFDDATTTPCECGMTTSKKRFCHPGVADISVNDVYFILIIVYFLFEFGWT